MPMAAAIPALISAGGAIAGGLANRKKTTTSTMTPTLNPQDEGFKNILRNQLQFGIQNPAAGLEPLRTAALENVNRRYRDAPTAITNKLAQRGYGNSGKMAGALWDTELSRLSDLSGVDTAHTGMAMDQQRAFMSLANQLLGISSGRTGTETDPGNVAGGAATGGLQGLMSILSLKAGMGGGSSLTDLFK